MLVAVLPDVRTAEHVKKSFFGQSQRHYCQDEAACPDGQDPEANPGFPLLGLEREGDGLEALHADTDQREQLDAAAQSIGELLQGAHRNRHLAVLPIVQEREEQKRRIHGALQEVTGCQADQQRIITSLETLGSENNPTDPQVPG